MSGVFRQSSLSVVRLVPGQRAREFKAILTAIPSNSGNGAIRWTARRLQLLPLFSRDTRSGQIHGERGFSNQQLSQFHEDFLQRYDRHDEWCNRKQCGEHQNGKGFHIERDQPHLVNVLIACGNARQRLHVGRSKNTVGTVLRSMLNPLFVEGTIMDRDRGPGAIRAPIPIFVIPRLRFVLGRSGLSWTSKQKPNHFLSRHVVGHRRLRKLYVEVID